MLVDLQIALAAKAASIESRAKAMTMAIPIVITSLTTGGYIASGDGGGAVYKRVAAQPAHIAKFQDASGAWFEYVVNGVVNVKQFGARGDDVTDDLAAFNGAINYMFTVYRGGSIYVPDSAGRYMVSDTIIGKSYVRLYGSSPQMYPYNNNVATTAIICSNFADGKRWVIDSACKHNGQPIAYNALFSAGGVPTDPTYNFTVENLLITSKNGTPMPFGGIRMQGGPGCKIVKCAVYQCGTGWMTNGCSGGEFSCFTLCMYYGSVIWDDVNACHFPYIYNAHMYGAPDVVPADYQWPLLSVSVDAAYRFQRDYRAVPIAFVAGGYVSGSVGNNFGMVTTEGYKTQVFMTNMNAANFGALYQESTVNDTCIVASHSRFNIDAWHCYMSGTGNYFAFGDNINAYINSTGIPFVSGWGYGPYNDTTSLIVLPNRLAYNLSQINIIFPFYDVPFAMPALQGTWQDLATASTEVECGFRLNQRTGDVEGQGVVFNGAANQLIATLPVMQRPYKRHTYKDCVINADGTIVSSAAVVNFNGVSFRVSS